MKGDAGTYGLTCSNKKIKHVYDTSLSQKTYDKVRVVKDSWQSEITQQTNSMHKNRTVDMNEQQNEPKQKETGGNEGQGGKVERSSAVWKKKHMKKKIEYKIKEKDGNTKRSSTSETNKLRRVTKSW